MEIDTINKKQYERIILFNTIYPKNYFIKDYDIVPIGKQNKTNNCVGHAVSYLINYQINTIYTVHKNDQTNLYELISEKNNQKEKYFVSASSIYYFARKSDDIESNDNADIGTKIFYGLESIRSNMVLEKYWLSNRHISKPSNYDSLTKFKINLSYGNNFFSVPKNLKIIKNYLCSNRPIILGININDQIFNLKFGQVLKCPKNLTEIKGAHAIVLIGYISELNSFVARNSFGINYCAQGYFLISYNYILSSFTYDLFIIV